MSGARWGAFFVVLAVGTGASPIRAQDTLVVVRPGQVGATMLERAVATFNRPGTSHIFPADTAVVDVNFAGDVGVYGGRVVIVSRIDGDLVAINADVVLTDQARIGGSVTVVGGVLIDDPGAEVGGALRRRASRARVRLVEERLELLDEQPVSPGRFDRDYPSEGQLSLLLGHGNTYNRVEGFPVHAGGRVHWRSGRARGEVRAYGIFRTAGDLAEDREDLGYAVEGRLEVGWDRGVTIGGSVFDVVRPTQDWPFTLHEAGWTALLWQRDYRDYFLQRGVSGSIGFRPDRELELGVEVARVEETSVEARDPWSVGRGAWRPNPGIDDGDFTLVTAFLEYDTRPSVRSLRSGTSLRLTWERGHGDIQAERLLPAAIRPPLPSDGYVFDRISVDARRYQRISRRSQVRLRGVWSGSVGSGPLPVQRRYSIGGPDPLMGFRFREVACGEALVVDPAHTGLCDHVLLLQGEYRGSLHFGFDDGWFGHRSSERQSRLADDWWFDEPTFVLLANAGTGWLDGQDIGDLHVSMGAGLEIGTVGVYVARALEAGFPWELFLRIERRF